jgi:hypothetical protein
MGKALSTQVGNPVCQALLHDLLNCNIKMGFKEKGGDMNWIHLA